MQIMTVIPSYHVILLRRVNDVLLTSKSRLQALKELSDLDVEIIPYLFMFLDCLIIADDRDCEISIDFHEGFPYTVLEESLAIVVLVEDLYVAGDDVKGIHAVDLLLLLLAFGDRSVLGKLIDVVQYLFFLVGEQIFQYLVDVLAEQ